MHYGVLVMETKLVKLGKVAKYIKNRVDIDCSNSGEYVSRLCPYNWCKF